MVSLLKFEVTIEEISAQLAKHKDFNYQDFFELLDVYRAGFFTYDNVTCLSYGYLPGYLLFDRSE